MEQVPLFKQIYFNEIDTENFSEEYYIVKNIQVLKGLLRKLLL